MLVEALGTGREGVRSDIEGCCRDDGTKRNQRGWREDTVIWYNEPGSHA